ncbi:VOC family protein [Roseibium litorale]|uniref:VOC family protein n=1 Tax=Roseibium litorale TaxID=2803841 RepID=A0ABR9CJ57_9HYPH|nr:VOC family protein [Roseibium litorale]MBD8890871.1 VOC family protein [Roseibium litorale]
MTAPAAGYPTLRVARPANDLAALHRFYCDGAGFSELTSFDHNGYQGLILGFPEAKWHLELLREEGVEAPRCNSDEHLLVLYIPDDQLWQTAIDRMQRHGYKPVPSHNPYWDDAGMTFEDPEGYRIVFQRRAWTL